MVRFEERMERERWDPWATEYLDYALLKRRVKEAAAYKESGRKELVAALTNVFQGLFDNEVEKVRLLQARQAPRLGSSGLRTGRQQAGDVPEPHLVPQDLVVGATHA